MQKPNLLCIAHRGAMGHAPENTLASIKTALKLGAKIIEIDVHFVDQELIVIHDHRVDRTTNGTGLLQDYTLKQLRALDAGNDECIPTLGSLLSH